MWVDELESGHDAFDRDVLIGIVVSAEAMMGRGHGTAQTKRNERERNYRPMHN
jgi:hypothetical protein